MQQYKLQLRTLVGTQWETTFSQPSRGMALAYVERVLKQPGNTATCTTGADLWAQEPDDYIHVASFNIEHKTLVVLSQV